MVGETQKRKKAQSILAQYKSQVLFKKVFLRKIFGQIFFQIFEKW